MRRSVLFGALAALALLIALSPISRAVPVVAEGRLEQVSAASLGVYAALRTINAAISLIQHTEVGATVGVTGSVQPLGWLDPVDDTVERFAAVVFWISLSAGVLSLALDPLSSFGWALLALSMALRCAFALLPPSRSAARVARSGEQGVLVLGSAFVLLPLVLWIGLVVGERSTQTEWDRAYAQLSLVEEAAAPVVAPFEEAPEAPRGGLLGELRGGIGGMREAVSGFYDAAGVFREDAERLFVALLTLSGIFLLRMFVLPVALLWAMLLLVRRLL